MDDGRPANERVSEHIRQAMRDGPVWPGARLATAAIAQAFDTTPTEVQFALQRLVGAGLLVDDPRHRLRAFAFGRIRRAPAESALIADAPAELSQLQEHWQRHDLKALKAALSGYLARRRRMAADVAELLSTTPATSQR